MFTGAFYNKYVPDPQDETPHKILSDLRWFPFFKYCRGATDGVHIPAYALSEHIVRYRDRHGQISQNVIATCDFDLRFLHLMPGYEGTAADGHLFDCARWNGFALPPGRYYLADAGFPNCDMLLAPYRGERYHLKEFGGKQRQGDPISCALIQLNQINM
jgi:hypothetical protein